MTTFILILILIVSYLIGSINSAILFGKLKGDDIRSHGSGNAGATNALRTYGASAGIAVFAGDCMKSAISCLLAILLAHFTPLGVENVHYAVYSAGLGAVLGHNFPLYFGFKGGKGISVSITALIFANWQIGLAVLILSVALIAITRYVSLGSVTGAVLFIVLPLIFKHDDLPYLIYCLILACLAIYKHRGNIKRLLQGTESKLGSKK